MSFKDIRLLSLVALFMKMWLQRRSVPWSLLVVSLATVRFACRSFVAGLTLEIYIVQFMLITNKWNSVFLLNIVIEFAVICLAAYLLKVMNAAFLSLLSKDKFALEV